VAQSTNHQPRSLTHDDASRAWEDAYAYKAEIERRESEIDEPAPWATIAFLLSLSAISYVAGMIWLGGL